MRSHARSDLPLEGVIHHVNLSSSSPDQPEKANAATTRHFHRTAGTASHRARYLQSAQRALLASPAPPWHRARCSQGALFAPCVAKAQRPLGAAFAVHKALNKKVGVHPPLSL